MDRIYFANSNYLKEFFESAKKDSNLNWTKIADLVGTTRSMIDNYRKGKLLIPEKRFMSLLLIIKEERREHFISKISRKNKNWGQILGGKKAYKLNKKSFEQGRKKGSNMVKYDFDIQQPLSEELCEFIGTIIGDGFTNKYGHLYQTQITGDKLLDKDYYCNNLKLICKNCFNISPKITINEDAIRLNIYSKRLFELLTKRFKIPAGVKCYTVKIPSEILNSPQIMTKYVLRGMFNTDGGVGFDKRPTYKKPYIRVNYTSVSKELISQIDKILTDFSIPHSIHTRGNAQMIQINGVKNVKLFLSEIGFSNPRHLIKITHLTS